MTTVVYVLAVIGLLCAVCCGVLLLMLGAQWAENVALNRRVRRLHDAAAREAAKGIDREWEEATWR